MGVITWNGSASTDYGTAANWSSGVVPSGSSNVVIPDTSSINNCILDESRTVNSFRIDSGGTFDGNDNLLIVDSEGDATTGASEGFAVNIDGIISGTDTDIAITTPATTKIDLKATSGSIRNLTINHASCVAQMYSDVSLLGNLTITAGQLTTGTHGYGYSNLTVTGATSVTGTLTCNTSIISLGSGKTDAFAVVVNDSGTFNGGSGTHTYGSLNVNSSAALFAFSSGTTTLDGKSNTSRIFSTSATDRITAAGTLNIATSQTPVEIRCDDDTAINNLTMNSSSKILHLINFRGSGNSNPLVIGGNLTITAGTVSTRNVDDTTDFGLTVTGHVSVDGTLTGNASAISMGSCIVNSGGELTAPTSSGSFTINSENASHAFRVSGGGTFNNSDGTLEIQTAAQTRLKMNGTGNLHNLTVNHASCQLHMESDTSTTVEGDLTITAGIVNTNTEGGASRNLTVGGGIKNTGTLTANASTIIITGEIAGFAFDQMGTFNAGTSTIQIGDGSTSTVGSSTHFKSNNCHNLTINQHQDAPNGNVLWRAYTGTELTIGGNLTVTRGKFIRNTSTLDLTVTGDVDVASVGQLGREEETGSNTFGSIVIAGTYLATSGTTTITNEKSGHAWKNNGGTFTHNNGKVLFDFDTGNLAGDTEVKENTFYDLEVKLDQAGYELRLEDHSSTNAMDILNNLTVTKGIFDTMTKSDTLTIHGQTIIESDGVFTEADHDTNKIIHNGIVRNSGTYKINDGTTVKMNGGIRNLGTITVA